MAKRTNITFDLEWAYGNRPDAGAFRCASWYDGKELVGTHDIHTFAQHMTEWGRKPVTFTGHNIPADLKKCVEWGIPLPKDFSIRDSLIGIRFVDPLLPLKGLKKVGPMEGYVYPDLSEIEDPATLLDYCGKDTYTCHNLADRYEERARHSNSLHALEMYYNLAQAFMVVELAGLKMDVPQLRRESEELAQKLAMLTKRIPDPEMITNDNLFRDWLESQYPPEQIALLPTSRKSKKAQVGKKYLRLLRPQTETLAALGEAKDADYYKTLFVDGPLKAVNEAGFYFPSYKLLVARTQRRSSEPNIQNWPNKEVCKECHTNCIKHGQFNARRAVVSRFPGGRIVSLDYCNLEARIFAWQAGCADFLNALREGGYIRVAEQCLGIKIESKKDPRYKQVKSTVLAVTYNMKPSLFAFREYVEAKGDAPRMTTKEAERHYAVLFNRYPELYDEMERRREHAWRTHTAFSSVGAPVALPIIPDDLLPNDPKWIENYRKKVENWAINYPTQSCAGYVTGCALYDLVCVLVEEMGGWGPLMAAIHATTQRKAPQTKLPFCPIIEVHDSLVSDAKQKEVKRCEEIMHHVMVAGKSLRKVCPDFDFSLLDTESKVAERWDSEEE